VCAWNATDALLGHFNCLSPTVIKPGKLRMRKKEMQTEEMEWKSVLMRGFFLWNEQRGALSCFDIQFQS